MLIEDISEYGLIYPQGTPKYKITLEDSEIRVPLLIAISNAFKFTMVNSIDENTILIGGNSTLHGDFTDKMKEFRKQVFNSISRIDDSIDIELKFVPLKNFDHVLDAQYEETINKLQSYNDLDQLDDTYFQVSAFDKKITSVRGI